MDKRLFALLHGQPKSLRNTSPIAVVPKRVNHNVVEEKFMEDLRTLRGPQLPHFYNNMNKQMTYVYVDILAYL